MAHKTLTLKDLNSVKSNGFDYICHPIRTIQYWITRKQEPVLGVDAYDMVRFLDQHLVDLANEAKLTAEQLQGFTQSKVGRSLGDTFTAVLTVYGVTNAIADAIAAYTEITE